MSRQNSAPADLRRILQQQLKLSRELVTLAEQQTDALIDSDIERLTTIEEKQRECLVQQEALEPARMSVTRNLAFALGMERVPPLSGLLPRLPPRDQAALQALREEFLAVQSELDLLKARNLQLLESGLEYVSFSLELLTTAMLQPARYGANLSHIAAPAFYIDSQA